MKPTLIRATSVIATSFALTTPATAFAHFNNPLSGALTPLFTLGSLSKNERAQGPTEMMKEPHRRDRLLTPKQMPSAEKRTLPLPPPDFDASYLERGHKGGPNFSTGRIVLGHFCPSPRVCGAPHTRGNAEFRNMQSWVGRAAADQGCDVFLLRIFRHYGAKPAVCPELETAHV